LSLTSHCEVSRTRRGATGGRRLFHSLASNFTGSLPFKLRTEDDSDDEIDANDMYVGLLISG